MEGVITRFRQQINENSKSLGWEHVFPEMNHNELVGWAGGKEEYAVVIFRSSFEHPRSSVRIDISKDIFCQINDMTTSRLRATSRQYVQLQSIVQKIFDV